MDGYAPVKAAREYWRWFNAAVEGRAAYLKDLVVPRQLPARRRDRRRTGCGAGWASAP